jgi:hypothetical protein
VGTTPSSTWGLIWMEEDITGYAGGFSSTGMRCIQTERVSRRAGVFNSNAFGPVERVPSVRVSV